MGPTRSCYCVCVPECGLVAWCRAAVDSLSLVAPVFAVFVCRPPPPPPLCLVLQFMVALEYTTETYSLAINFMDRFFSKVTVDQDCMQTLAIACCLTASKVQGERPIAMVCCVHLVGGVV